MLNASYNLAHGRALISASLRALARHPRLLVFPFITFVCMLGSFAFMAWFCLTPDYFAATGHGWREFGHWQELARRVHADSGHWRMREGARVWIAAQYLVFMFVATFVNVALTSQSLRALAGESVSVRAGFACALKRVRIILLWSLFAGLIGLILERLAAYCGWAGRLGLHLTGMTWSAASVFVIPMIIREENTDPVTLLRKSSVLIRKTWGEGLVGFVGIGLVGMLPLMAFVALVIWSRVGLRGLEHTDVNALFTGAWIVGFAGLMWVSDFTRTFFRSALYVYASEGVVPEPFSTELMDGAWKVRK
jgi:Family of unknown function (DUF6159)